MRLISAAFAVALLLVAPALAQPLADRVPDDSIIYLGWCGSESVPSTYQGSHLKAVLDNSKMRELFTQFLPQVLDKLIQKEPKAREPLTYGSTFAAMMWKHPTAMYFAGVDMSNPNKPLPKIGLVCKAGADAPALLKQVSDLLAKAPPDAPIRAAADDGLVIVTIGHEQAAPVNAGGLKQSLAFTAALKQVQTDPIAIGYVDVEKLLGLVEQLAQASSNSQAKEMLPKVIDALGVRGLKRVIHTAAFDGEDWMGQTFVEMPAPRTGMLEALDGAPISPDLLKVIPADATFAASARFDAAKCIAQLRTATSQIDPKARQVLEQVLGAVQLALAKNPVSDLLEPLGSDWAAYCAPSVAGNGILETIVVNRLDDPAKAQSALPTAWVNLSNWAAIALSRAKAEVEIVGRNTKIGDLSVFYIGSPIIAPAWTIKDGYLYMGLFPQTAAAGARSTARGGKSIADNEKFIALQKRLGVSSPCSFSFYDLQTVARTGSAYQQWLLLGRYAGIGDLFGIPLPEPLVPMLEVLEQNLGPAGSAAWVDDAGYHVKSISPFPGSKLLSEPGMIAGGGAAGGAMAAAVLMPALSKARESAKRVASGSQLRQIGMAITMYANDHKGQLPLNLGALVEAKYFPNPQILTSPLADTPGGNDFVYLGSDKLKISQLTSPGMIAVVYDSAALKHGDGTNVLFVDGHVEWVDRGRFEQVIQQSKEAGLGGE